MPDLDDLLAVFALEPTGEHTWRGDSIEFGGGSVVFGGQLLAQSMLAGAAVDPAKEVKSIHTVFARGASTDAPLDFDPSLSLGDTLADTGSATPESTAQHHEVEVLVGGWLERLSDKQRFVVERRFGLNNHDTATLEDLADELGLTRERVRQIQQEALVKLKRTLATRGVGKDALL